MILDCIVEAGVFEPRWLEPFMSWYAGEQDLRGHDQALGWLHAVAHGADLLGSFGQIAEVSPRPLLELGLARVLTPTSYPLRDLEDDRLAYALSLILTRPDLSDDDATAWLAPAPDGLRLAGFDGGIPAQITNTFNTLRALYVYVSRESHRKALLEGLADVLLNVPR